MFAREKESKQNSRQNRCILRFDFFYEVNIKNETGTDDGSVILYYF